MRSFSIIVYVTNCNVVTDLTDIFRSEIIKEILNGLISIVNISSSLPTCIVYGGGCHLIRRLIDGQPNGVNGINTEACEQLFSWTNRYATAFTNMNVLRLRTILLLKFHLRNYFLKNINSH